MARQIIFGVRPRGDAASGSSGDSGGFESGTRAFFQQTTAPTGWTKDTTHNDKALRIVSGAVSSGGATAFSSVMGSGKTTGSHTLTTSEIPSHNHAAGTFASAAHTHPQNIDDDGGTVRAHSAHSSTAAPAKWGVHTAVNLNTVATAVNTQSGGGGAITGSSAGTGGGGGHTHTLSLDLQYVDTIIAQKD